MENIAGITLLNSRLKWNNATESQQLEVIIELVKNKLADFFDFIGLENVTCGDVTNTIGVFEHQKTKMIFHLIPGEEGFMPGANEHYDEILSNYKMDLDEFFEEAVTIKPFLISRYLVTEKAWNLFDGKTLHFKHGDEFAIEAIEKGDVMEWGEKVNLRLPTEFEWEYACKAGTTSIFYWGNQPDLNRAWTRENMDFNIDYHQIKEENMDANGFGLRGMIGNLAEWVLYNHSDKDKENGILRGGWNNYDWGFNRSTSRIDCSSGDTGCSGRVVFDLSVNQVKKVWKKEAKLIKNTETSSLTRVKFQLKKIKPIQGKGGNLAEAFLKSLDFLKNNDFIITHAFLEKGCQDNANKLKKQYESIFGEEIPERLYNYYCMFNGTELRSIKLKTAFLDEFLQAYPDIPNIDYQKLRLMNVAEIKKINHANLMKQLQDYFWIADLKKYNQTLYTRISNPDAKGLAYYNIKDPHGIANIIPPYDKLLDDSNKVEINGKEFYYLCVFDAEYQVVFKKGARNIEYYAHKKNRLIPIIKASGTAPLDRILSPGYSTIDFIII